MRSLALVLSVLSSFSYCQGYILRAELELALSWPFFKLCPYYLPGLKFSQGFFLVEVFLSLTRLLCTRLLLFVDKHAINVGLS